MPKFVSEECQVCGNNESISLYPVKDTNQDVKGQWEIIACLNCGLGRLYPFPDQEEIHHFYKDVFYTKDGKRFRPWMEKIRHLLGYLRALDLRKLLPSKGKLLDFGSGAGHFGLSMEKRGWRVVNTDPYSKVSTYNRSKVIGDRIFLDFPDNYFDAVTLWYVIEHLRNPRDAIREFKRVIRPGGILLLAQQNFVSLQARLFKARWLILDPPRHLFQFSPHNLLMLAEQEGFKLAYTKHSSIEIGPFTILQSILNVIVGNNNYLFRFLKNPRIESSSFNLKKDERLKLMILISFSLSIPLAPFSLILYFILLFFRSGDTFNLYLVKES